jgi:hypothetical protein
MTILLRDSQTGRYYSANETWCAEALEAMVFDSVEAAAVWAQEQNLNSVQVVMHYEEPRCDLALPLDLCLSYFRGAGKKDQKTRHLG